MVSCLIAERIDRKIITIGGKMNAQRIVQRLNSIRKKSLKEMRSINRYLVTAGLLILVLGSVGSIQTQAAVSYVADLTRYPYLTDVFSPGVGSAYATINFATLEYQGALASARFGRIANNGSCTPDQVVVANPATRFRVQNADLTNTLESQWSVNLSLLADTEYCYRVFLNKGGGDVDLLGSDPNLEFRTLPRAGVDAPLKFIIFGDWGEVDGITGANPHQQEIIRLMSQQGAQFALTVGDNTYNTSGLSNIPNQTIYGDLYHTEPGKSAVFGPNFWTVAGGSLPLFPAVGNHIISAVDNSGNHPDLVNFPQKNAVTSSGGISSVITYPPTMYGTAPADYPSLYYAFSAGLARFYVLDAAWANSNVGTGTLYDNDYVTHWTPTSPEYLWLENDLKTHSDPIKFVIFHFPMYSDGPELSDTRLQGPTSLEGLLTKYGAQFGFSGHSHIYERNQAVNGLTTYVTGGGGSDLVPIGPCNTYDLYGIGWSSTRNAGSACGSAAVPGDIRAVYHFLLITVDGARVTITPINELGDKFDEQVYNLSITVPPPQDKLLFLPLAAR